MPISTHTFYVNPRHATKYGSNCCGINKQRVSISRTEQSKVKQSRAITHKGNSNVNSKNSIIVQNDSFRWLLTAI